jgi:hypothetical protein
MATRKRPATPSDPPPAAGKWRIVGPDGHDIVPPFASEALARDRWYRLTRTRAGDRAKLLRPDGSVDTSMDRS